MKQVKNGMNTSEFWLTVVTAVLTLGASSIESVDIDKETISSLALLIVTYIGGRSAVKAADIYASNRDVPPATAGSGST